jgi:argininosuccinate lyase
MQSKVSGLLHEPLSAEVQVALFLPWIEQSFAPALPLLTQINLAHVVMLFDRGILPGETAAKLLATVQALAKAGP